MTPCQVQFWHKITTRTIIPNEAVSIMGFQNFFLLCIGGTILEGLAAELDSAHSLMFQVFSMQCTLMPFSHFHSSLLF